MNLYYSILVSTYTLFFYYANEYETKNFSKTEAKVSLVLASFCNYANFKVWKVRPPEVVVSIANHPGDDLHKGLRFIMSVKEATVNIISEKNMIMKSCNSVCSSSPI